MLERGPLRQTWVARHRDRIEGVQLVDAQVHGPFARWRHTIASSRAPHETQRAVLGAFFEPPKVTHATVEYVDMPSISKESLRDPASLKAVRVLPTPRRRFGTMPNVAKVRDDFDEPPSIEDLDFVSR